MSSDAPPLAQGTRWNSAEVPAPSGLAVAQVASALDSSVLAGQLQQMMAMLGTLAEQNQAMGRQLMKPGEELQRQREALDRQQQQLDGYEQAAEIEQGFDRVVDEDLRLSEEVQQAAAGHGQDLAERLDEDSVPHCATR